MSSKNLLSMALTAAAAFLFSVAHANDAQAGTGVWTKSSWSTGFESAENNVIYGLLPDSASGLSQDEGSKSYDALTDGYAQPKTKDQTTCLVNNASLTYSLKAPCDISEVRVYSTWADSGRDELSIDKIIAVKSTGEEVVLNSEGVKWDGGSDGGNCGFVSLKMAEGPLCTDVSKIVFKMGIHEYNRYIGYAELEVLSDGFKVVKTSPVEIGPEGSVEITASPDELILYGLNGGNLTISGADTVVAQNLTADRTFAGIDFSSYWPWIEGTVTVKDGATLTSNTMLFRGSGVQDGEKENYREKTRLLIVQSGAKASFSPPAGYVDIVGIRNGTHENASVLVEGEGSALTLPDKVYVGKKNDGNPAGHHAKVEIKNGGLLEAGTLYLGWNCTGFEFLVDGATVKALKGISVFEGNARWTASTISFKDCLVETPFYKCAHASSAYSSDKISFDGAVFRPVGEVNAKYFDTTPVAGEKRIVHTLSGNGLIIEAPEGTSLEVSGMFNGDGGFTKRGAGTVVLSANNEYAGATVVAEGTLRLRAAWQGRSRWRPARRLSFLSPPRALRCLKFRSLRWLKALY
ncbi:MAG: autotransporter-associated beta strand repeat-containing protein [Kiritimatiellae bacterium]|nr:autotransporter-associated beta strand repeat-containing protein [Kiritimatiellia bacterium]